jgi:hypothetical protein
MCGFRISYDIFLRHLSHVYLLPPNAQIKFDDSAATVYKLFSRKNTAEYLVGPRVRMKGF